MTELLSSKPAWTAPLLLPLLPSSDKQTHLSISGSRDLLLHSQVYEHGTGTWDLVFVWLTQRQKGREKQNLLSAHQPPQTLQRLLQPPACHYNWLQKNICILWKKLNDPTKKRTPIKTKNHKETKNKQTNEKNPNNSKKHKKTQKNQKNPPKKPNYKQNQ